ncbi:MAG: uracil-DNA glycosylase [Deltaproteobacteria bacterium]|nr:uracil-DNA glycosylase [Deltaproteobacteria bacterium]
MTTKQPACRQCRHYYITYDPQKPHGCRAYAFKAKVNPAQVVLSSSGKPCLLFTPRENQS